MLHRCLILLSIILLLSHTYAQSNKHSNKQSSTQSNNQAGDQLTCDNGTVNLSMNQLNDNYCDCLIDGSDEPLTGACVNGKFRCINQYYLSTNLSSSFVRDGICDCCDGSDEANYQSINQSNNQSSDQNTICPNTCYEKGQKWLTDQSEKLRLYKEGVAIRQSRMPSMKQAIDQSISQLTSSLPYYREQLASIGDQYNQLVDQLNQLQSSQHASDHSVNQLYQSLNQVQSTYQAYQKEYQKIQGMVGIEEFYRSDGQSNEQSNNQILDHKRVPSRLIDARWFSLINQCYDLHSYQRRYDEHGINIDSYLITICPLKNITQIKLTDFEQSNKQSNNQSIDQLTKQSRELVDRLIDRSADVSITDLGHFEGVVRTKEMFQLQLKYEAAERHHSIKQSNKQSEKQKEKQETKYRNDQSINQSKQFRFLSLANNGSYPLNNYRTGPPVFYLRYTGGSRCWGSQSINQSRQSIVIIECGLIDRLIDFTENGMCQYELRFQSPIACVPRFAKQWEKQIQQFQQQWSKEEKHEEL